MTCGGQANCCVIVKTAAQCGQSHDRAVHTESTAQRAGRVVVWHGKWGQGGCPEKVTPMLTLSR